MLFLQDFFRAGNPFFHHPFAPLQENFLPFFYLRKSALICGSIWISIWMFVRKLVDLREIFIHRKI